MDIIANTVGVVAAKLVLAVILGALLGLERSLARKTAGMRTYTLVSMGAALFVIIAEMVAAHYSTLGIRVFDPLRVASQVIVGIGFLGAGLIIFQDNKLRGLTTAAGLWVAAGIGMAVGYGLYILAAMVTILTLFVFTVLWYVEQYLEKHAPAPAERED
jgi:putative Mg2+ transporter-C (MgtC) family protein